ncbi:interaptin-like [Gossypium hirsutum]|uniref:Interaptin-like n=1 Tax=Gossypium hirsutum TaxID=3635 RepID=A0A1U8HMV7_GOSHI|nr:interaptin-like [Gossypium hirsutum]
MEEQLQVAPSELEIIRQDFEKKSSELGKRIEQLEEGKMHLKLDMEVQKSEAEKLRKRKNKVEEDLESLKTNYKKLRLSMRTESKNEQDELRARVAELERSLCLYRNHNSVMELRASLRKIKEMKEKIEELETTLQSFEMRIEFLEANEEQWKGQLHYSQDQVRSRDYIMGEAVTQIREVVDYLQTLVVQADILSVKYELELDKGQELASLVRKIKALSIMAKSYL